MNDTFVKTLPPELTREVLERLTPWRSATLEQVRHAVLNRRLISVYDQHGVDPRELDMLRSIPDLLAKTVSAGRLFDFGYLPNSVIRTESKRCGPLFQGGHLGHPFRDPYVIFHTWEQCGSLYLVVPDPVGKHEFMAVEFEAVDVAGAKLIMLADVAAVAYLEDAQNYVGYVIDCSARAMLPTPSDKDEKQQRESRMCNVIDPVCAALLLLATDGVPVDRVPAPEKLNKQRLKNGKPAIPPHWKVQTANYVTALSLRGQRRAPGQGGHHASPVPHLRRGHVRHLHERHGGGTTLVRDALVLIKDGVEMPLARSFYSVHRDKPCHKPPA